MGNGYVAAASTAAGADPPSSPRSNLFTIGAGGLAPSNYKDPQPADCPSDIVFKKEASSGLQQHYMRWQEPLAILGPACACAAGASCSCMDMALSAACPLQALPVDLRGRMSCEWRNFRTGAPAGLGGLAIERRRTHGVKHACFTCPAHV